MAIFWYGKISGLLTGFALWMWNAPNPDPVIPIIAHIMAIMFGLMAANEVHKSPATDENERKPDGAADPREY